MLAVADCCRDTAVDVVMQREAVSSTQRINERLASHHS